MRDRERSTPSGNRLIDALPGGGADAVVSVAERVTLELKDPLFDEGKPIDHVYFPIHGVASIVTDLENDGTVEIATVGHEGMVGIPLFLGVDSMHGRALQQIPGEALRIAAADFTHTLASVDGFRDVLNRYTYALFALVAQGVSCNRLHTPEQRCARWLLMTHDRVHSDEFPLTQEFLAQMLAVRRATVSEVARRLQGSGSIRYSRGVITVVGRRLLEVSTCECYWVIREEFDRVLD